MKIYVNNNFIKCYNPFSLQKKYATYLSSGLSVED